MRVESWELRVENNHFCYIRFFRGDRVILGVDKLFFEGLGFYCFFFVSLQIVLRDSFKFIIRDGIFVVKQN